MGLNLSGLTGDPLLCASVPLWRDSSPFRAHPSVARTSCHPATPAKAGSEAGCAVPLHSYCAYMKNITLKVDEATYDRARVVAAKRKTSISGLVREYLNSLADTDEQREAQRLEALEQLYRTADARAISSPDEPLRPLSRDAIYAERLH